MTSVDELEATIKRLVELGDDMSEYLETYENHPVIKALLEHDTKLGTPLWMKANLDYTTPLRDAWDTEIGKLQEDGLIPPYGDSDAEYHEELP